MYEKQVHKDGIKRVVLSSDSAAARYFDKSELKELFKLSADGVSPTLEKFNKKANNNAPRASFLAKHPSVIGVVSHDELYCARELDNDDLIVPKSEVTPFSRSPFQKTAVDKNDSELIQQLEDLTIQPPVLKPLGGMKNKTKSRRGQINSTPLVETVLRKADQLIARHEHLRAINMLLDLLENEMINLEGNEKLALHTKVSHLLSVLGLL
jgi:hypothetical protein